MSFACAVTEYSMPASSAAISAVRPDRDAKWAWRWVMPRSATSQARSIAWCTSGASYSASSGSSRAKRSGNSGIARVARANTCHASATLYGLAIMWTGACTRAISGWKRVSVVGRSANTVNSSPAASRARISVTMKVSEKRG